MARPKKPSDYFDKLETDIKSNQSTLSLVLGALIVLVVGVLIFNYFNRSKTPEVGPAQTTEEVEEGDVSPENLPGKYTVKEGDTLFIIAEKYYKDGFKYSEIATTNKLANVDAIEVGQVLEIPKLAEAQAVSEEATETAEAGPEAMTETAPKGETPAIGGADTTIWGPAIKGDSYTVVEGDWLSTIAGRAYGDIFAYKKLAEANSIQNPDLIIPGQEIKIPR